MSILTNREFFVPTGEHNPKTISGASRVFNMIENKPSEEQNRLSVGSNHDILEKPNQPDLGRNHLMGGLNTNWLAEELASTRRAFAEWTPGLRASYGSLFEGENDQLADKDSIDDSKNVGNAQPIPVEGHR